MLENLRVLYVEDDEMIRDQVKIYLRKKLNKLFIAENGMEALTLFREKEVDLIVTDLRMPVMDGIEFCQNIRQINKSCPIIITTAFSDVDTIINAVDLNIDKYLLKPIKGKELTAAIEEVYDVAVSRAKNDKIILATIDFDKDSRKAIEKSLQIKLSQFIKTETGKGPRAVNVSFLGDQMTVTLTDSFTQFQRALLKNRANMNMVKYMRETFFKDYQKQLTNIVSEETGFGAIMKSVDINPLKLSEVIFIKLEID